MKQPNIVFRFLFPSDKNSAKTIKPAMGAFNNPATCFFACIYSQLFGLITTGFYMCGISKLLNKLPHFIKIISFVKAEVLPVVRPWFRTLQDNTVQRCLRQFHVVPVCPVYRKANRNPCSFTQHRPLNASFAPVSRVFACFFPRPVGLWSSLHPLLAISSQDHAEHHIPTARFPKIDGKRPLSPTLEIVCALLNQSICLLHQELSIGTLFSRQTECRSLLFDKPLAFSRPRVDGYLPARAAAVQSCSTVHRKSSSGLLWVLISCFSPKASLPQEIYRQLEYNNLLIFG